MYFQAVPTVKQTKVRLFSVTGGPFFGGSGGVGQPLHASEKRCKRGKVILTLWRPDSSQLSLRTLRQDSSQLTF